MNRNSICIGDTGAIITLAVIEKLDLLSDWFDEIYIPIAVWEELVEDNSFAEVTAIKKFFDNKVKAIRTVNDLKLIMDLGESEAVILYREMNADVLLIDDRKARQIAESLNINCIGSLALLIKAREAGRIGNLREVFTKLLQNKRYFAIALLNEILATFNEKTI